VSPHDAGDRFFSLKIRLQEAPDNVRISWASEPTGKSLICLSSPPLQKYSDFQKTQITFITFPSCPTEGRLEIVTDAGQDAVDADAPFDERRLTRTEKACGPDAPTLASSS